MTPNSSGRPWRMPPEPLVGVRYPTATTIELVVRPGANFEDLAAASASLPQDAFYLDHRDARDGVVLRFHRVPDVPPELGAIPVPGPPPPAAGRAACAGTGERYREAVAVAAAGVLLGVFDDDILAAPARRRAVDLMTLVALVRTRANALSSPRAGKARIPVEGRD